MFDVVEYLNPELEERCRLDPTQAHLNYHPVLKEADRVTIGCREVLHANAALPPISSANERVIQIVPAETYKKPLNMQFCIVPPLQENSDWMTWHDRGVGTHDPETRQPPALAYHSGTVLTQNASPNYVQQPQTQQNAGPNYVQQQVQPSQNAQGAAPNASSASVAWQSYTPPSSMQQQSADPAASSWQKPSQSSWQMNSGTQQWSSQSQSQSSN
eukprot:4084139-Amphidinium_carterae.1